MNHILLRVPRRCATRSACAARRANSEWVPPRSLDQALDYAFSATPGHSSCIHSNTVGETTTFSPSFRGKAQSGTEIGRPWGTLFLLTRVAAPDRDCRSVDLSSRTDRRFEGRDVRRRRPLFRAFALTDRIHFLVGDSHAVVFKLSKRKLVGRRLIFCSSTATTTTRVFAGLRAVRQTRAPPWGVIACMTLSTGPRGRRRCTWLLAQHQDTDGARVRC